MTDGLIERINRSRDLQYQCALGSDSTRVMAQGQRIMVAVKDVSETLKGGLKSLSLALECG